MSIWGLSASDLQSEKFSHELLILVVQVLSPKKSQFLKKQLLGEMAKFCLRTSSLPPANDLLGFCISQNISIAE